MTSRYVALIATLVVASQFASADPKPQTAVTGTSSRAAVWEEVPAQEFAAGKIVPPLESGYESVTGAKRQTCVKRVTNPTPTSGETYFQLTSLQSSSDIRTNLNVSASASFDIGLGSADLTMGYVGSSADSQFNENLIFKVVVQYQVIEPAYAILPQFAHLSADDFRRSCGDSFVSSYVRGGDLVVAYSFRIEDSQQRRDFRAHGSGSFLGSDFNADLQSKLEALNHQQGLQIQLLSHGPVEAPTRFDGATLMQYARDFPSKVKQANQNSTPGETTYISRFRIVPYTSLGIKPSDSPASDFLNELSLTYLDLVRRKQGLSFIKNRLQDYPTISSADWSDLNVETTSLMRLVRAQARLCAQNTKACSLTEFPVIPDLPEPADDYKKVPLAEIKAPGNPRLYETKDRETSTYLDMKGAWAAHCVNDVPNALFFTAAQSQLVLEPKDGSQLRTVAVGNLPHRLPANTVVSWLGEVTTHEDDCSFSDNWLSYRVYQGVEPLNAGDFSSRMPKPLLGSVPPTNQNAREQSLRQVLRMK